MINIKLLILLNSESTGRQRHEDRKIHNSVLKKICKNMSSILLGKAEYSIAYRGSHEIRHFSLSYVSLISY